MNPDLKQPTVPWWRVPVVWLVIGGPAMVVVACMAMLVVALRSGDPPLRAQPQRQAKAGDMTPATQARNHAAAPRR
jgi:hypothetical protein